ncbi:hypothetical protein PTKIN_Ptkin02bG0111500 [Pterospermum kingtungense]
MRSIWDKCLNFVKVDWTPELHRRFVQAVEQLGVDKAKYRSHRKHLLAREAEAASWTHKRQIYCAATLAGGDKRDMNTWHAPTMGFPPMSSPMGHHFRPWHSKESVDAAIGDVLSKPCLPLPLGLKPPSTDTVLGELQRQGVPKIPPSCA